MLLKIVVLDKVNICLLLFILPLFSFGQSDRLIRDIAIMNMTNQDSAFILIAYADSLAKASGDEDLQMELMLKKATLYHLRGEYTFARDIYFTIIRKADQKFHTSFRIRARLGLYRIFSQLAKADSALYYTYAAERIALEHWNELNIVDKKNTELHMGLSLLNNNQYSESIEYFKSTLNYFSATDKMNRSVLYLRLAQAYLGVEKADSFIKYRDLYHDIITNTKKSSDSTFHSEGIYVNFMNEVDIKQIISILPEIKRKSQSFQIANTYEVIAKQQIKQQEYGAALTSIDSSLAYVNSPKQRAFPLSVKHDLLNKLRQYEAAYKTLNEYHELERQIVNDNSLSNINRLNVEFETEKKQKALIEKELLLNRSNNTRNILLGISSLFLLLLFGLWQRYRRVSITKSLVESEYEKKITQLQLASLRSQMNPHFLFNTLNSINWYIIKNKSKEASKFLTKFSKLMRLILENSKEELITLAKEIQTLKLYIDLEEVRFEGHFYYSIQMEDKITADSICLPPLIIQPFIENAIWHGLVHKKDKGHIIIDLSISGDQLIIKINDDGIGRAAANKIKNKTTHNKSSEGIKITESRINGLIGSKENPIIIEDLIDDEGKAAGTSVSLYLPLLSKHSIPR